MVRMRHEQDVFGSSQLEVAQTLSDARGIRFKTGDQASDAWAREKTIQQDAARFISQENRGHPEEACMQRLRVVGGPQLGPSESRWPDATSAEQRTPRHKHGGKTTNVEPGHRLGLAAK